MTRVPVLLPGGTVDWVDDQDEAESDQVDRPDTPGLNPDPPRG